MPFSRAEYDRRYDLTRGALERLELDAVIAYATPKQPANVRWLAEYFVRFSGVQTRSDGSYLSFGSCACLFPRDGAPRLFTDQPWDVVRARETSLIADVVGTEDLGRDLGESVREGRYGRVAIDSLYFFPAFHHQTLTTVCPDVEFRHEMFMSEL